MTHSAAVPISIDARKSQHVREVFEDSQHYLQSRGVDVRLRAETVKAFAKTRKWKRLLDIGCGDGSISLPLLTPETQLTLLDLSTSMTTLARERIPEGLEGSIEIRNENFMEVKLGSKIFDLIVTVGVLAHVDSPDGFLGKIRQHLQPGGSLIVEFTDCRHPVGQAGRLLGRLKEAIAPPRYHTNKLSFTQLRPLFQKHSLKLIAKYRYSRLPLPGIDTLVSHELQYALVKRVFRDSVHNTHASFGNEYICLLEAE